MYFSSRSRRTALLGVLALSAVAWLYASTYHRLTAARQSRRNDDYAAAEAQLAACWHLPGLWSRVDFEEQLLGVQQGDLREEKTWQDRAARHSAEGFPILEALAKGNLAQFQYNEARDYADSILHRDPESVHALWLRGRAWVPLQQEEKALQDFQRAIDAEPRSFPIRLSLADLLHKLGHVRDAIGHYEHLRNQQPANEHVVVELARCLQEQNRLTDARTLLDGLLLESPGSIPATIERSRVALRMSEPDKCETWLRSVLIDAPDNLEGIRVLKQCLQAQQKSDPDLDSRIEMIERQQADFRLQLHDSGRQPALLTEFGRWTMRTGGPHDAPGWFYAALKEDASFRAAHTGLADYFANTGQFKRANLHSRLGGTEPKSKPRIANREPNRHANPELLTSIGSAPPNEASSDAVHRLCAACHAYPPPETMPRAVWRKEVKLGYDFLRDSTLQGKFPPLEDVVLYYDRRAPQQLPLVEHPPKSTNPPVKFEKRGTGWMVHLPPYPGVANTNLANLFGAGKQELLLCDTRLDRILVLRPYEATPGGQALPQIIAPSHTAVTDLDGDGRQDILVAALGNFFPTDDKVGNVVWLRANADGKYQPVTLLERVGRVSDVQAADFNGDGKLDLVVAVFGWRNSGEILYLENRTTDWSRPEFAHHQIDSRHGAIHVPVADLNGDERPDFVALISQEHETVVAYLNQGNGAFQQQTLFTAPHPTFGSSGIQIADLDSDGDLDVLLTNGDVLDRPYLLKPYHGVQWLENEGTFPFTHRLLSPLYGASRAVAADFDGDSDLDVAAVSFLPRLEFPERENLRLPAVVLYEQTSRRQFQMHILETGACDHFTCAAGDWDADGKIDLAVGNYSWKRSQSFGDAAVLWRNMGKRGE